MSKNIKEIIVFGLVLVGIIFLGCLAGVTDMDEYIEAEHKPITRWV